MKKITFWLLVFLATAGILSITSCGAHKEDALKSETISISENAQGSFFNLRVGIGFIGDDPDILKSEGKKVKSVQIWPFVRGEEKGRPSMLLHKGDKVEINGYQVEIVSIGEDSVKIKFSILNE